MIRDDVTVVTSFKVRWKIISISFSVYVFRFVVVNVCHNLENIICENIKRSQLVVPFDRVVDTHLSQSRAK